MSHAVLGRERKIRERERGSPWAGRIRGMMLLALCSLLLLAYVWLVSTEIPTSPYVVGNSIFILAGQSNMAGRGGVVRGVWDAIVPTQCQPNPSILRLSAGLEWEGAHEPLHADIDRNKTCGVGPGMAFANALLEKSPTGLGVVGLVPCAVGGTSISQWSRGTKLYNDLVARAKAALQDGGSLKAILWYQGERDTLTQQDADAYQEKLAKFMVDVRSDLQSISVPIFQVGLASGEGAFVETVREAQAQVCVDVAKVMCVDAKGLPLEPDALHLTTPAQVLLGHMLADAYLHILIGLGPPGPIQGPLLSHALLPTSSYLISNSFFLPIFTAFLLSS